MGVCGVACVRGGLTGIHLNTALTVQALISLFIKTKAFQSVLGREGFDNPSRLRPRRVNSGSTRGKKSDSRDDANVTKVCVCVRFVCVRGCVCVCETLPNPSISMLDHQKTVFEASRLKRVMSSIIWFSWTHYVSCSVHSSTHPRTQDAAPI